MSGEYIHPDLLYLNWLITECGYLCPKPLKARPGWWGSILPQMLTHAIIIGRMGDRIGYEDRWCYHDFPAAWAAFDCWDGTGEPKGWHRHPPSGRRVSEDPGEVDERGHRVGAIGVVYVRR